MGINYSFSFPFYLFLLFPFHLSIFPLSSLISAFSFSPSLSLYTLFSFLSQHTTALSFSLLLLELKPSKRWGKFLIFVLFLLSIILLINLSLFPSDFRRFWVRKKKKRKGERRRSCGFSSWILGFSGKNVVFGLSCVCVVLFGVLSLKFRNP